MKTKKETESRETRRSQRKKGGDVMISHRGYDTDAYFSLLPYLSPLAHPIPIPICLDCSYPLSVTHTRPLGLFSDYFSYSYSWALRLRLLVLTHS
jgi:hypothetical protein